MKGLGEGTRSFKDGISGTVNDAAAPPPQAQPPAEKPTEEKEGKRSNNDLKEWRRLPRKTGSLLFYRNYSAKFAFGPAQSPLVRSGPRKRKADYVEIAAFDAGDVSPGLSLDGVRAGFIVRLLGGEIRRKFFVCDRPEMKPMLDSMN